MDAFNGRNSEGYLEIFWNKFLNLTGDDFYSHFTVGLPIVLITTFWISSGFFAILDWLSKYTFLGKYKIQPEAGEHLDWKRCKKVILQILFNHIFVVFPASQIGYFLVKHRGVPNIREVPTLQRIVIDFIVSEILWEIAYYYSHRLLHTKYLYKHLHKRHHDWTAPFALVSQYSHPVQFLITDITPPFVGSFLMGSHLLTFYLYTMFGVFESCVHHSGYRISVLPYSEYHDYHHKRFNECYGIHGIMDFLHGTDKAAIKHCSQAAHLHSGWEYLNKCINRYKGHIYRLKSFGQKLE